MLAWRNGSRDSLTIRARVVDPVAGLDGPATVTVDGLDYHEALNATGISGGIAGNVVPDRASVVLNHRSRPTAMRPSPSHAPRRSRAQRVMSCPLPRSSTWLS